MNKIILSSISFIGGGIIVFWKNYYYINYLINKNNNLAVKNEKLSYELNKIKKEINLIKKEKVEKEIIDEKEDNIVLIN